MPRRRYLPRDTSRPPLGTSIYVPKERRFTCPGTRHHSFEAFDCVRTMPYAPNAMFAFIKTPNSFHGAPVEEAGVSRDLLLHDVFHRQAAANPAASPAAGATTRFSF